MKVMGRILIILLAAGIVSGSAYALVQSGVVVAPGPGLGRERGFPGRLEEGRLPGGAGEFGQPPAALRGRLPEGGAFNRADRGFTDGDFRREGRGGIHFSSRTWATLGRNLGIIAAIVLVVGLVNWASAQRRMRQRRAALDASSGTP